MPLSTEPMLPTRPPTLVSRPLTFPVSVLPSTPPSWLVVVFRKVFNWPLVLLSWVSARLRRAELFAPGLLLHRSFASEFDRVVPVVPDDAVACDSSPAVRPVNALLTV